MQSQPENEPLPVFDEYFRNDSYKNILALSVIFMFSIVFNLIYLAIDFFTDKDKHYNFALQITGNYWVEPNKSRYDNATDEFISQKIQNMENYEIDKEKIKRQKKRVEYTVWSYRNLQVSFIHSTLCSIWLFRIMMTRYEALFNDLLYYVSWDTYLLVAFTCGYFLYDFYDIYASGYVKKEASVCLHHVIVLISFTYHITHLISVGYTVCALFMEVNSVFLHARKLMKFYGYKKTDLIVRMNKIINLLTFIIFRFGVLYKIYSAIYYDGHTVDFRYSSFLFICTVLMTIINVILFKRLVLKDFFTKENISVIEAKPNKNQIYAIN